MAKNVTPARRRTTTQESNAPLSAEGTEVTALADPAEVVEGTEGAKINLDEFKGRGPALGNESVTAIVPKAYVLTRDNGEPISYPPGIVEMPRADAAHWWSKAQGVKEYDPSSKAIKE